MANSSIPIRLDAEITASARQTAARMTRSVAEQISHWARLGRELERSPGISVARIRQVLADAEKYDTLPAEEQAVVRTQWAERLDALRSQLRLDRDYARAGYRYAELDDDGRVVVRKPLVKAATATGDNRSHRIKKIVRAPVAANARKTSPSKLKARRKRA